MANRTLVLTLKTEIDNANAPYLLKYDPIEDRKGSLFLWDAGLASLSSVPTIDAVFPNILNEYVPASGNALILKKGTFGNAVHDAYIRRELTSKGGIHFIVSQNYSGDTYATISNALAANPALQTVLRNKIIGANPNLFISMWTRLTRNAPSDSTVAIASYVSSTSSKSDYAFYKDVRNTSFDVSSSSLSTSHLNKNDIDASAVGQPNKHIMNLKGYGGAGVLADTVARMLMVGYEAPWSGTYINKSPSFAVYRIYIEDLTLSGRTYAQVKAIDDAEFAKAFASGGRFHGDTWSNPSTVLP